MVLLSGSDPEGSVTHEDAPSNQPDRRWLAPRKPHGYLK